MVCETDGFSLRAAVLRRADHDLNVLYRAQTEQVDMAEGLGDVLAALKNQGWQGGGAAILLSPAVFSTLVELPVNPKSRGRWRKCWSWCAGRPSRCCCNT